MKKDSHVTWLVSCPTTDVNFRQHLRQANEREINLAMDAVEKRPNNKTKLKALASELRRRTKGGNLN